MSTETKHTPPPWKLVFSHDRSSDVGITADGMDNVLAECFAEAWAKGDVRPHEARANAAFIVDACNNYARLKANADALRNFVEYYLDRDCSIEDCDKVARALLAKIDKERGES